MLWSMNVTFVVNIQSNNYSMDMSIALLLWLQSVWAQDVYMSVGADGTISFTDSPSQDQDFVV